MSNDDEIIIGLNRDSTPKKNKKHRRKKKRDKRREQELQKAQMKERQVANDATSRKTKDKPNRKPKKSSKFFKMFLTTWVLALVFFVLMNLDICKIQNIELVNAGVVTLEQVKELADFEQYNNLFSLNTIKIEEDIKKNAYVEDVKVSRKFPNTVKITIKERTPRYMLQVADSYVYINNQGYMLDISVNRIEGIPIILGFKTDLSNAQPGNRLDLEDLKQMDQIIKIVETANINDIGSYITKIDVSDDRNYILVLEGERKTVYLGDCSNLNTRMLYLSGILTQTKNLAGEIFLNMDLNTEDAYFIEKT